jgi:plastocyanin
VAQNPNKPVKATYTFPQAGTFKLVCFIHPPDMAMTVVVKPEGAAVPTPEEVLAKAQEETAAAWAAAKALVAQKPPKNTIYMGVENAKQPGGRTTVLDFIPNVTTVKAGTTVSFRVKAPTEAHNVAFGPLKYLDKIFKETDLFPMGPNAPNQTTPFFVYGSDAPGTPYEGRTMHGNGFYATPLGDGIKGGLPNAYRVRFTTPGKYHFICMLHGPDMAADIRVTR